MFAISIVTNFICMLRLTINKVLRLYNQLHTEIKHLNSSKRFLIKLKKWLEFVEDIDKLIKVQF